MTSIPCPLCREIKNERVSTVSDIELFTSKDRFNYYLCGSCRAIFIYPQPIDKLDEIYPDEYYANAIGINESWINRIKESLDRRMFKKTTASIPGKELSALDIGGGSGWMLNILQQADTRVTSTTVVDMNLVSEKFANENGHKFFCGKIEDVQTDEKYDIILLLNLIEHVSDPGQILRKVKSLLKPEGLVIVKTPNTDSFDQRLFLNHYWGGLHCPRHWILFNAENFTSLVKNQRLTVEKIWYTQGAPQWTASILGSLWLKKWIKLNPDENLFQHWLALPVLALSAAFDLLRLPFAKTSQFFIILKQERRTP